VYRSIRPVDIGLHFSKKEWLRLLQQAMEAGYFPPRFSSHKHMPDIEVFLSTMTVQPFEGIKDTHLMTDRDATCFASWFIGDGVRFLTGGFVDFRFNSFPTIVDLRCDLTPEAVGQAQLATFFFFVIPTPPTEARVGAVFRFVFASFDKQLTGVFSSYAGPRTIVNYPPILSVKHMTLAAQDLAQPVVFEEYKVGPAKE
jgi:hypothetical protein